jgi:hypothetical protein
LQAALKVLQLDKTLVRRIAAQLRTGIHDLRNLPGEKESRHLFGSGILATAIGGVETHARDVARRRSGRFQYGLGYIGIPYPFRIVELTAQQIDDLGFVVGRIDVLFGLLFGISCASTNRHAEESRQQYIFDSDFNRIARHGDTRPDGGKTPTIIRNLEKGDGPDSYFAATTLYASMEKVD